MTKAFYPRRRFRSISITGYSCELNCEMCRGRYLRGMIPAPSPPLLRKIMEDEMKKGVIGFLISGGFDKGGVLPFRPFLNEISEAKKRGAIISIHPGLIDEEESSLLREFVDIVDFELLSGKAAYIKGGNPDLYRKSFEALMERGPKTVPHVIIGMPFSSFEDFKRSVDLSYEYGAEELVVLVFIPTVGTAFQNFAPSLELVKRCISYARKKSNILSLGCMIPKNMKKEIDNIALEEGVDRIVLPSIDRDFQWFDACCSVPENMLYLFK